jgi:hypothetical protein
MNTTIQSINAPKGIRPPERPEVTGVAGLWFPKEKGAGAVPIEGGAEVPKGAGALPVEGGAEVPNVNGTGGNHED